MTKTAGGAQAFVRRPALRNPDGSTPSADQARRHHANQTLKTLVLAAAAGRTPYLDGELARLAALGERDRRTHDEQVTLRLWTLLSHLWEAGWQPADLVHAVRRTDARSADFAADLVLEDARRTRAMERAPGEWRDQLRGLAEPDPAAPDAVAALVEDPPAPPEPAETGGWLAVATQGRAGVEFAEAWVRLLVVASLLERLPRLEHLVDPPSAWTAGPRRPWAQPTPSGSEPPDRAKLLARIRALLAKAEATEYAGEAEAFSAKAQDLMSRHAIDEALLHAREDDRVTVVGRRIHLAAPYVTEKAQLVHVVAEANRARAVMFSRLALVTVVGTPVDTDQVEMLFTSLLVQATRAMAEEGRVRAASWSRSSSFRRSFLASYATRIGERLAEADAAAVRSYGAELVPVLQHQEEAVETEVDRLFPRLRAGRSRSYDGTGWAAGRAAADRAVFAAGRLGSGGGGG